MIIGRSFEQQIIQNALNSKKAELGIVYGRRRVGKSALLRSFINSKEDLYFEGIKGLTLQKQIDHFTQQLAEQTETLQVKAKNWSEAFRALTPFLVKKKKYVVFDEFPWMASERSELVALLKYFWDNKWKENPKLTLVLCGSVASYMVRHVLHSEALHNRKTFEIQLDPLSMSESKSFFRDYRSSFEVAQFLMVFGGIPKYLEQLDPKKSLALNINHLCLNKHGFFVNEFETLFKEQFKVVKNYESIVKLLSAKSLSKEQIAKSLGHGSGGSLTTTLENLERAQFIKSFSPMDFEETIKSKTKRYVLWDEWTRFYLTFMRPHLATIRMNSKQNLFESYIGSKLPTYMGFSFEKLCLKNIHQILQALEIELGELSYCGPYFRQGARSEKSKPGVQIDIMLIRKRNILTLIECKFMQSPVDIQIIKDFEKKISALKAPKRFSIEKVLIAANGASDSLIQAEYFNKILTIEDLLSINKF
ncbi:MAG: AAA family ATPase [Pseudobdellovibrionaceae bacterium]